MCNPLPLEPTEFTGLENLQDWVFLLAKMMFLHLVMKDNKVMTGRSHKYVCFPGEFIHRELRHNCREGFLPGPGHMPFCGYWKSVKGLSTFSQMQTFSVNIYFSFLCI